MKNFDMRVKTIPFLSSVMVCLLNQQAFAQSKVSFHVKTHDRSCKNILFTYKDTKKPGAKQVKVDIKNSSGRKGDFSPLLTVNVEPGHHHIYQITCKGKTASKNYALIHALDASIYRQALRGYKSDELHYDIADGETVYLGAFERINMGEFTARRTGAVLDLSAPIVSDQSNLALANGSLSAGAFRSSLIGVTFDVDSVLGSKEKISALREQNDVLMKAMGVKDATPKPIPADGGKGELALHYYNSLRCNKPRATLSKVNSEGEAEKSYEFKFKKAKSHEKNSLFFKSLPSGRYELIALKCQKLFTPNDLYAVFDIHNNETTYGGEVNMDVKFTSKGKAFKLSTKDRYEDAVTEGGTQFDMKNRNGFTPAVFEAQNAGRFNRINARVDQKLPYYQTYKDAQIEYSSKLVLPQPKENKDTSKKP